MYAFLLLEQLKSRHSRSYIGFIDSVFCASSHEACCRSIQGALHHVVRRFFWQKLAGEVDASMASNTDPIDRTSTVTISLKGFTLSTRKGLSFSDPSPGPMAAERCQAILILRMNWCRNCAKQRLKETWMC